MKPSEYLDALRIKLDLPSDYALRKYLGVSTSQLSKYRKNQDFFSDELCFKVAEHLKKQPVIILLDMQRERAKTPEAQAVWNTLAEKFSMGFNVPRSRANPHGIRLSIG